MHVNQPALGSPRFPTEHRGAGGLSWQQKLRVTSRQGGKETFPKLPPHQPFLQAVKKSDSSFHHYTQNWEMPFLHFVIS